MPQSPSRRARTAAAGPVPNAVLKVPTGGGKTWLAVSGVSRIMGRYLDRNTGFVLWIVPNEAIYSQTLRHLKDREHPYRQALDRAAAGRVRIMEKTDPTRCARRRDESLRHAPDAAIGEPRDPGLAKDVPGSEGDVHGFFPPEGEQQAHKAALERTPNLAAYNDMYPMVKDSLGNALRVIRPVVILDEGHRAISDLAFRTLYDFNPCFVLELTATPKDVQPRGGWNPRPGRYANLLVEVTGRELDREGMIKMPLNLDPRQGTDWRATLNVALMRLNALDVHARQLRANTNRYIRPIMLVQVERTGAAQRDGGHIHAEDVKDWLLTAGFDESEIAIKTAERNDLTQPENQDLLSATNRVRVIITKQALQEGWDCPFAYVLCALAASSNQQAFDPTCRPHPSPAGRDEDTRRGVGRMPYRHASRRDRFRDQIHQGRPRTRWSRRSRCRGRPGRYGWIEKRGTRRLARRPAFASTEIYLPKVMIMGGRRGARSLITKLTCCPALTGAASTRRTSPPAFPTTRRQPRASCSASGWRTAVKKSSSRRRSPRATKSSPSIRRMRYAQLLDIVPNPFVGREIVGRLLAELRDRGFDDGKLGRLAALIAEELRKGLDAARDTRAEALFKDGVVSGRIQFRLRLDGCNWRMPFEIATTEPINAPQLVGRTGCCLGEKPVFAGLLQRTQQRRTRSRRLSRRRGSADSGGIATSRARSTASRDGRRGSSIPISSSPCKRTGRPNRITVLDPPVA